MVTTGLNGSASVNDEEWVARLSRSEGNVDEPELREHYLQRLNDWFKPGLVKIDRNGKLLGPPIEPDQTELRKRIFKLPWARPNRRS